MRKKQMTQKEVHELGIRCRWYHTLERMRECMSRRLLTEDQIRATASTDPELACAAEGQQKIYRGVADALDDEIRGIDSGLAQFSKLYGLSAYQMFYQYFVERQSLDSIAEMQKVSASTVRRAIRMIGNGHSTQKGGN
jgi:hypothetical protein